MPGVLSGVSILWRPSPLSAPPQGCPQYGRPLPPPAGRLYLWPCGAGGVGIRSGRLKAGHSVEVSQRRPAPWLGGCIMAWARLALPPAKLAGELSCRLPRHPCTCPQRDLYTVEPPPELSRKPSATLGHGQAPAQGSRPCRAAGGILDASAGAWRVLPAKLPAMVQTSLPQTPQPFKHRLQDASRSTRNPANFNDISLQAEGLLEGCKERRSTPAEAFK